MSWLHKSLFENLSPRGGSPGTAALTPGKTCAWQDLIMRAVKGSVISGVMAVADAGESFENLPKAEPCPAHQLQLQGIFLHGRTSTVQLGAVSGSYISIAKAVADAGESFPRLRRQLSSLNFRGTWQHLIMRAVLEISVSSVMAVQTRASPSLRICLRWRWRQLSSRLARRAR